MVFIGVGAIVLALLFAPIVTIWALNTLFPLAISYTVATWCAVVWLGTIVPFLNWSRGAKK